jgi:hypothetical protein
VKYFRWLTFVCLVPGLAYAGLTNAQRKSEFEKALSLIISSATPQVPPDTRETMIREYQEARINKGFAVELVNANYWRSTQHERPEVTRERTLEGCQLRFGHACALVAVNDEITSEGQLISEEMARLKYAGKFDPMEVPIIRSAARKHTDVSLYTLKMEPKAMAIHPYGKVFVSVGNENVKEAAETALAKCNSG